MPFGLVAIAAAALIGLAPSVAGAQVAPETVSPAGSTAPAPEAAAAIMQRFLARRDPDITRYRAIRRLEASARGGRTSGWVDARTELDTSGFHYEVLAEGGNGIIRGRVLKAALEAEASMRKSKEDAGAALTPANYEFTGASLTEDGYARISIRPRRRDVTLIDGSLVVTRDDADLVRVEGVLAKRPSFWTRRVRIVRRYGRIGGQHVPLSMESTADVLIVGRSSFSMVYQYESLEGRDVGAEENAAAQQRAGTPAGAATSPGAESREPARP